MTDKGFNESIYMNGKNLIGVSYKETRRCFLNSETIHIYPDCIHMGGEVIKNEKIQKMYKKIDLLRKIYFWVTKKIVYSYLKKIKKLK